MQTLRLALTSRCRLNCPSCYAEKCGENMPRDLAERVITTAAKEGFEVAAIGGGEPLEALGIVLHAIHTANQCGMQTAITTSGLGLTVDVLRKMDRAGLDHIQLSLGDNRVNLLECLPLLIRQANTTVGINFLLSPRWIPKLEELVKVLDTNAINQVTLLLPKSDHVSHFTRDQFMCYYENLKRSQSKLKHTTILIDCLTHCILTNGCVSQGCTIFPNGELGKCAFHPYRHKWSEESISKAIQLFPGDCPEMDGGAHETIWEPIYQ